MTWTKYVVDKVGTMSKVEYNLTKMHTPVVSAGQSRLMHHAEKSYNCTCYIHLSTDYLGTRQIIFRNNMNTIGNLYMSFQLGTES